MAEPETHVVKLGPGEKADQAVLDALKAEGWELEKTLDEPGGGTQLVLRRIAAN